MAADEKPAAADVRNGSQSLLLPTSVIPSETTAWSAATWAFIMNCSKVSFSAPEAQVRPISSQKFWSPPRGVALNNASMGDTWSKPPNPLSPADKSWVPRERRSNVPFARETLALNAIERAHPT